MHAHLYLYLYLYASTYIHRYLSIELSVSALALGLEAPRTLPQGGPAAAEPAEAALWVDSTNPNPEPWEDPKNGSTQKGSYMVYSYMVYNTWYVVYNNLVYKFRSSTL